jgi:hypothetical protein
MKKKVSESAKINSPLAAYSSNGQLSCKICRIPIKSNAMWTAHIGSQKHNDVHSLRKQLIK